MNEKRVVLFGGLLTIGLFLAACAAPPPTPKVNDAAGTEIVATFMAQITQTAVAASMAVTPTPDGVFATEVIQVDGETEEPSLFDLLETLEVPDGPILTTTPDLSLIQSITLVKRFRFVTASNGNLYVRDGMELPKQITQSGTDHDPVISDDGQKIVFYRGEKFDNVFVINADGSGEKELVGKKTFPTSTTRKILSPTFRLGTNYIIFSTYTCQDAECQIGVFRVDTESLAITELVKGLPTQRALDDIFKVSPDGQFFVVKNADALDLYSIDGKILQANFVSGAAHAAYWLPDSSGLIVLSASRGDYSMWRYTLKDRHVEKISIDPVPAFDEDISCYLSISPDRNWIFYQDHEQKKRLGNLTDAQTQVYAWGSDCVLKWSPDSQHFASQTEIGSVDGTPPIKLADGHFIAWLDDTHYLFSKGKSIIELKTYIAEVGQEADATQIDFLWSPVYAVIK